MPLLGTLSSRPLTGLSVSAAGTGRFAIAVGTRIYSDPDGTTWDLAAGIHGYASPNIAEGGGTIWVSDRTSNVSTMHYSRNFGASWTSKTMSQSVKWGQSIAVHSNGLNAIASGTNATPAGRYAYIANYTGNWTVNNTPGATNNTYLHVGFGNNLFVGGLTSLANIYSTATGATWTLGSGYGATAFANGSPVYNATAGRWQVPKTSATNMYTSTNGTAWTGNTLAFTPVAVAYGAGRWVAISTTGNLATSTNGTAWTTGTSLASPTGVGELYNGIAYGNGVFLVSTNYGKIYSSTTGLAYNQRATAGAGTAATASRVIFVSSWPR